MTVLTRTDVAKTPTIDRPRPQHRGVEEPGDQEDEEDVLARSQARRDHQQADEVEDHPDRVLLARSRRSRVAEEHPQRPATTTRPAVSEAFRAPWSTRRGRGPPRPPGDVWAPDRSARRPIARSAIGGAHGGDLLRAAPPATRSFPAEPPDAAAPATTVIEAHDRRAGRAAATSPTRRPAAPWTPGGV